MIRSGCSRATALAAAVGVGPVNWPTTGRRANLAGRKARCSRESGRLQPTSFSGANTKTRTAADWSAAITRPTRSGNTTYRSVESTKSAARPDAATSSNRKRNAIRAVDERSDISALVERVAGDYTWGDPADKPSGSFHAGSPRHDATL